MAGASTSHSKPIRRRHSRVFETCFDHRSSQAITSPADPRLRGLQDPHVTEHLPLGGLTALSERSMIAASGIRHFAVGPADWKVLRDDANLSEVAFAEDGQFALDVWRYDPVVVTGERKTDPLSLYLQFREDRDERVVAAAKHLLEAYPWFRD